MEIITVECQNDDCRKYNDYKCESESCGEGTTHVCVCDSCGTKTQFDIVYGGPMADDEREIE